MKTQKPCHVSVLVFVFVFVVVSVCVNVIWLVRLHLLVTLIKWVKCQKSPGLLFMNCPEHYPFVMSPCHSDKMCQRSHASRIIL